MRGGGAHPSGEALEAELAAVRERLGEVESAARGRSERARAGVAAARAEAQEAREEAASLRAALQSALADASAVRREAERAAAAARETDASAAESIARAEAAASAASAAALARQQELEGAVEGARERAEYELRAAKDAGEARAQALQENIDSIHRRAAEEGAQAAARIEELEVAVRAGAAKTAQGTRAAAEAGARAAALRAELDGAKRGLEEQGASRARAERDLARSRSEVAETAAEAARLREEVALIQARLDAKDEDLLRTVQETETSELQHEVARLRESDSRGRAALEALRRVASAVPGAAGKDLPEDSVAAAVEAFAAREARARKAQEESLRSLRSNLDQVSQERDAARKTAAARATTLSEERCRAEKLSGEAVRLRRSEEALKSKLKAQSASLASLSARMGDVEALHHAASDNTAKKDAQVGDLRRDLATEQERRQALESECAAAKEGLADKNSRLGETEEALARARDEIRDVREAESALVSEHQNALERLQVAEQGRSGMAEEAARMEQAVTAKAQRIRELSNAASNAMEDARALRDEKAALQAEVHALKTELEEAVAGARTLAGAVKCLKADVSQGREALLDQSNQTQTLLSERDSLAQKLSRSESAQEGAAGECDTLRTAGAQREAEMQQCVGAIAKAVGALLEKSQACECYDAAGHASLATGPGNLSAWASKVVDTLDALSSFTTRQRLRISEISEDLRLARETASREASARKVALEGCVAAQQTAEDSKAEASTTLAELEAARAEMAATLERDGEVCTTLQEALAQLRPTSRGLGSNDTMPAPHCLDLSNQVLELSAAAAANLESKVWELDVANVEISAMNDKLDSAQTALHEMEASKAEIEMTLRGIKEQASKDRQELGEEATRLREERNDYADKLEIVMATTKDIESQARKSIKKLQDSAESTLKQREAELEGRLQDAESAVAHQAKRAQAFQEEIEALQGKSEGYISGLAALRKQLKAAGEERSQLETRLRSSAEERKGLEGTNSQMGEKVRLLRTQLKNAHMKRAVLEEQMAGFALEAQKARKACLKMSLRVGAAAMRRRAALKRASGVLRTRLALRKADEKAQSSANDLRLSYALQSWVAARRERRLGMLREEHGRKVSEMRKSLEHAATRSREHLQCLTERYEEELESVRKLGSRKEGESLKELKAAERALSDSQKLVAGLKNRLDDSHFTNQNLEAQVQDGQSTINGLRENQSALKTALHNLRGEMSAKTSEVARHVAREQQLDDAISSAEAERDSARSELDALQGRASSLQEELDSVRKDREALQESLARKSIDLDRHLEELAESQLEASSHSRDGEELRQQIAALESTLHAKTKRVEELRTSTAKLAASEAKLRDELGGRHALRRRSMRDAGTSTGNAEFSRERVVQTESAKLTAATASTQAGLPTKADAACSCVLDCRPQLTDRAAMTDRAPDAEEATTKPSFVAALQTELADQKRMCMLLEERLDTSILSAQLPMECSDETEVCSVAVGEAEVVSGHVGAKPCALEPFRGKDASTQSDKAAAVVHSGIQCSVPAPMPAVPAMPESERCGVTVGTQVAGREAGPDREPHPRKSSTSQTSAPSAHWDKGVQTGDAEIKRLEAAQVTIEGLKESLSRLQQEKNELEGQIQDAVDLHSAGEQVSFLKKQLQLTRVHALRHHEEVTDLRRQLSARKAQAEEQADRVAYLQREAGEMRLELQEKDRVLESALVQVRAAAESAVESARLAEACKEQPERAPDAGYGVPDELFRSLSEVIGTWRDACRQKDEEVRQLTRALERTAENIHHSTTRAHAVEAALEEEREQRGLERSGAAAAQAELDRQLQSARAGLEDLRRDLEQKQETFAGETRRLQADLEVKGQALLDKRSELKDIRSELKQAREKFEEERQKREAGEKYRESALKWRTEALVLKQRVEHKTKEIRELNHMLKAWDSMRSDKDDQISGLMDKCRQYEDDAKDKARSLDALRRKLSSLATPRTGRTPPSAMPSLLQSSEVTLRARLAGPGGSGDYANGAAPPRTPRLGGTPLQGRLVFPASDTKENAQAPAGGGKPAPVRGEGAPPLPLDAAPPRRALQPRAA